MSQARLVLELEPANSSLRALEPANSPLRALEHKIRKHKFDAMMEAADQLGLAGQPKEYFEGAAAQLVSFKKQLEKCRETLS